MTHFKSNLRDLEFNLFEVFDTRLGQSPFAEVDIDVARSVLNQVDFLSRTVLAASFADGDRNPPILDPESHSVSLPKAFKESYAAYVDAEFWRLDLPSEMGGTPAPRALWWSLAELVLGANPAIWLYATGPGMVNALADELTAEQRQWASHFVEKRWGGTMVLTEPDAGSDVGSCCTRAVPQADGSWHIEGVKRFITSGEHDLAENIIHYVLARPADTPGAGGPGTKGLSLFIVPKFHFDPDTGHVGERNGVFATNVERKMGINASATCELTFGSHGTPATGWLVGEVHDGIRQMFLIIENARMMVGTKAIATLSTGYLNALEYAKSRIQGADLRRLTEKASPRIAIINHPDVRRSLMLQKSYAEGLRALFIYTATWADRSRTAAAEGDLEAAETARKVNDLLLPLVKACGSERAFELLGAEALQTFGGSGFTKDFPLEQYLRDSKIDSLYEGTTAIQSLDLFFRKIVKDNGVALFAVAGEINDYLAEPKDAELQAANTALAGALANTQSMLSTMTRWLAEAATQDDAAIYKVGLHSRRLILSLGDLIVGWLLLRQAAVSRTALRGEIPDVDRAFYLGKIAAARFFASEVLPRIAADRTVVEAGTLAIMEVDESFF